MAARIVLVWVQRNSPLWVVLLAHASIAGGFDVTRGLPPLRAAPRKPGARQPHDP